LGYGILRLDISPHRLSIKSQPQRGDHQSPEFQGLFISKDSQGTIELQPKWCNQSQNVPDQHFQLTASADLLSGISISGLYLTEVQISLLGTPRESKNRESGCEG